MPWIHLPNDDATPELARTLRKWRERPTGVPHIVGISRSAPGTLRALMQLNDRVTFGGSRLPRREEELIATTTSALNDCFY